MDSTGNSVQPTFQHNANELVAVTQKKRTPKGKNIVVLKKSNVSTRDEEVYMPNTIEMAQLKKPEMGQFKTNVQISSKMTEMDIKRILVENFPFLAHQRFWCASAVDNRTRLDFHGERRIWDGRFLKQTIKGNSALYIFTDEQIVDTQDPKVSEQSTLKRSHDQITTLENDQFDQVSKRTHTVAAAAENVSKHTIHTTYPGSENIGGIVTAQPGLAQKIISTASDQQSLGNPVFHIAGSFAMASHEMVYSTLTSEMGNLDISKAASLQSVDVEKSCAGKRDQSAHQQIEGGHLSQPVFPVTMSAQSDRSFPNKLCSKASAESKVSQSTCTVTHNSNQDLNPCTSAQSLPQISGQQATPYNPFIEDYKVSGQQQLFPTVIDNSNQTDQIGWYLSASAHSSHQTEEQSNIDHAITTFMASTDPLPELDVDVLCQILEESEQGSSSSDRELTTTSGMSDDDGLDFSEQDQNLRTWEEERYTLEIDPKKVSMKGGRLCELAVIPMFPVVPLLTPDVLSVEFVHLQTVQAERCGEFYHLKTPSAQEPGWYTVILRSHSGEKLGTTEIEYMDEKEEFFQKLVEVVEDQKEQKWLIAKFLSHFGGKSETSSGEKQNSGNLGSTQAVGSTHALSVEVLQLLVYAVAKVMFNSSPGKEIVDSHEESAELPEFIARSHGHEDTAGYLEDIITRISKQMTTEGSQTIDWSELMAAAEAAQEQHGLGIASGEENHQPESDENSDYYGDVESLSCDSSEPTSDSEDDFSEMFSKVSVKEDEIQLEEDALEKNKDENTVQASCGSSFEAQVSEKEMKVTNNCLNEGLTTLKESVPKKQTLQLRPVTALSGHLMSFVNEGVFPRKQLDIKVKYQANKCGVDENYAFHIAFCDRKMTLKSVGHLDILFFPSMTTESIPRHLSTMCERWGIQLRSIRDSGEMTTHWLSVLFHKMHSNPAKGCLSVSLTKPAFAVENNFVQGDGKLSAMKPLQLLTYSPVNGASDLESSSDDDGFSSPNDEDSSVRWEAFDYPTEHCHVTASDIWVLTSIYRPTRKSLLVYVADSKDVLFPECFKDEDCELLMRCWKWQWCRNKFSKRLKDMQEQSEVSGCTDGPIGNHDVFQANRAPDLLSPMSPIALASEHCHPFTVSFNKENEAMAGHQGFNNIMSASSTDSASITVVSGMATPKAQIEFGKTTLTWAAKHGHFDTCKLLLETGAKVDQQDKGSSFPSTASTSQEGLENGASSTSSRKMKVTLFSSEWKSTKGGLSTINRELAIQLAKHPNVEVSVYLPQCSEENERVAAKHNVHLIEAEEMLGYDPVDWLASVPKYHVMDCTFVIGHGLPLGRQVPHIKRHHNCKWIQVAHTAPEELGMYKSYSDTISEGEKKHQAEVRLCKLADHVVAVGPKLAEPFLGYLRSFGKDRDVLNLTPGIFSEFADVKQATKEIETFSVLVFGRGDSEDFQLKDCDIAAQAIAELNDMRYNLGFVGASSGDEKKVEEMLLQKGIDRSQLGVRCFQERREKLVELFYKADLAIMPSRIEGFGLAALEALSAGLPVPVKGNFSLGEALPKVPYGSHCVVESEDPAEWAKAVRSVRQKDRKLRLEEFKELCGTYAKKKYNWEEQCDRLVETMMTIILGQAGIQASGKGERPLPPSAIPAPKQPRLLTDGHEVGTDTSVVVKLLKAEYNRRAQLRPLLWGSTIQLPLENVYTRLKIVSRRKEDIQVEDDEVNMFDIFKARDKETLSSSPCGICFIINNLCFHKESKNRYGGEKDEEALGELFVGKLNFGIHVRNYLENLEMLRIAEEFTAKDHSEHDAFVCIIMSHGKKRDFIDGVKGRTISIEDLMMPEFEAEKCPTLAENPKRFIIQACGGPEEDESMLFISECTESTRAGFCTDSTASRSVTPQESDYLFHFQLYPDMCLIGHQNLARYSFKLL